jgi:small conductance mechanosensitive channel
VFSTEAFVKWLLETGVRIGAIILVAVAAIAVVRVIIARSRRKIGAVEQVGVERAKRTETLTKILETTATIVVLVAALLMVLKQVGIEIGPLLAGAGIIGLAVSFGAQSLVKDIINGFFFLLENDMNVGDVVAVGGVSGLVERINLRVTVLRDLEGKVHIVPNGQIAVITNMTKEWSRAVVDVGVPYEENIDRAVDVLKEIGEGLRADPVFGRLILEPMTVLGVDAFAESSINIKVMFKTQPIKQWEVGREFRRRVKNVFDERKMQLAYPAHVVHLTP